MHAIGNALLGGAASSLCALECDAFNVPLGAANLDLSNKRLGAAAATLLAGVIKGNTTITSLKCVQPRISHMVAQCLRCPKLFPYSMALNILCVRPRLCVSAH